MSRELCSDYSRRYHGYCEVLTVKAIKVFGTFMIPGYVFLNRGISRSAQLGTAVIA